MQNIKVYLWEGTNKTEATRAVNYWNAPAVRDKEYSVNSTSGFLLISIPEANMETNFEFEYWLNETYIKSSALFLTIGSAIISILVTLN